MSDIDIPLVTTVAAQVGRRFPRVERDDITQELCLWWVANVEKVDRYLQMEDQKQGEAKLNRALRNAASTYAHQETALVTGYQVEDLFFYSPGLLRELLPTFYGDRQPAQTGFDPAGRSTTAPNEGNNFPALMEDVRRGLAALSGNDASLLEALFRDERPVEELAAVYGVEKHAMEMRVQRALGRLRDKLGGPRPDFSGGPGARHAMSNAQAQAITRAQTEDE